MNDDASLGAFRRAYPWPDKRPDVVPIDWSLDAGGKRLVSELIVRRRVRIVLEIGAFLGGSVRTWLRSSPDLMVIALDEWADGFAGKHARESGKDDYIVRQLEAADGLFRTFLHNMWPDRGRVIPMRERSPAALSTLKRYGIAPDLVFLDADKSGREIDICTELFPETVITGDDWWWGTDRFVRPDEGYPIRGPVKTFCRKHGRALMVEKYTWAIDDGPASLRYRLTRPFHHMKSARRRIYALARLARNGLGFRKRETGSTSN